MADASQINFAEEFDGKCLSNAEMAVILDRQKRESEREGKPLTRVFQTTLEDVERFSGITDPVSNQAAVEELRQELERVSFDRPEGSVKLHQFEIARLSNLIPGEVEKATTLIPSLQDGRFRESEIEEILTVVGRTTAHMMT